MQGADCVLMSLQPTSLQVPLLSAQLSGVEADRFSASLHCRAGFSSFRSVAVRLKSSQLVENDWMLLAMRRSHYSLGPFPAVHG